MRVVQVSFFVDSLRRSPEDLLDIWSGLTVPAEAASYAGCEVFVVHGAAREQTVLRGDVRYHFVKAGPGTPMRRALGRWASPISQRVIEKVAELRPELVHVHGLSYPRHTEALLERMMGVPVVLQDHADQPPPNWRREKYRKALQGIKALFFTAKEQAAPFLESGSLPEGVPVHEVIESTSTFTPSNIETVRLHTGMYGDPCFLWVGRLDENKDPLAVLDAFARAAPSLPDPRLFMCFSDAPLLPQVKKRILSDKVLSSTVSLLGYRSQRDVEQLMRSADFLVTGSHHEGSGYAVIEALACGTTPLVTDIPSLRRILANGAVGSLTPPGDAAAMTDAMVQWGRRDPVELRTEARAHYDLHLSVPAIGFELRSAYNAIVGPRHRPGPLAIVRGAPRPKPKES